MKNKTEIENQIKFFEARLVEASTKYQQLNQIDMLSKEGSELRYTINTINSKIDALKLVLAE